MADSDLSASLLLAMPQLQDPNFRRSVVLLVEHDEAGTFGLVLNRPVDLSAAHLCQSLDVEWRGSPNADIHWGGPVQPHTGWMLFDPDATLVSDADQITPLGQGISFAGSLDVLREVAGQPPPRVRLFLGYAGWAPGQLEAEMTEGAWLVAPLSAQLVFGAAADVMWERAVRGLGIDPATLNPGRGIH